MPVCRSLGAHWRPAVSVRVSTVWWGSVGLLGLGLGLGLSNGQVLGLILALGLSLSLWRPVFDMCSRTFAVSCFSTGVAQWSEVENVCSTICFVYLCLFVLQHNNF